MQSTISSPTLPKFNLCSKDRFIIKSSFMANTYLSYGILPYCPKTDQWLLVQRRHSYEFINIMRGSYRQGNLTYYLHGMSYVEIAVIRYFCTGQIDPSLYNSIYCPFFRTDEVNTTESRPSLHKTEPQFLKWEKIYRSAIYGNNDDLFFSWNRLNECKSYFLFFFDHHFSSNNHNFCYSYNEWTWPKGRPITSYNSKKFFNQNNESPRQCAYREFTEETGIKLNSVSNIQIIDNLIIDKLEAIHGQIYETHSWVVIFDTVISPPNFIPEINFITPGEIGDRGWFTTEQVRTMLRPNKLTAFELALNIVKQNLFPQSLSNPDLTLTVKQNSPTESNLAADLAANLKTHLSRNKDDE